MQKRVLIIQRVLTDYRVPVFDLLSKSLQAHGVQLTILAGQGRPEEYLQEPDLERDWLRRTRNTYLWGGLYVQKQLLRECRSADLVIVEQSSKSLLTYILQIKRFFCIHRSAIAYWGHGIDFSDQQRISFRRQWKKMWTNCVDYWFAYTDVTARLLIQSGFPKDSMTVLDNAADTEVLASAVAAVGMDQKLSIYHALWNEPRNQTHRVAVFCSRLIPSKGVGLLLESSRIVVEKMPSYRLLIIGDGPLRRLVESYAAIYSWCVYLPPVYGVARAPYLALSDIWLNPGTTGLAILDAYAAGLPYLTVDLKGHMPEIAYLDGFAGQSVKPDANHFADAICKLLQDEKIADRQSTALLLAKRYTLGGMVSRFCDGILCCLRDFKNMGAPFE